MTEEIIDGVKITTDDSGNQHFELFSEYNDKQECNKSWFSKIINWFTISMITPYVKVRNLSDPIEKFKDDPDIDPNGPKGIEAGIKIEF